MLYAESARRGLCSAVKVCGMLCGADVCRPASKAEWKNAGEEETEEKWLRREEAQPPDEVFSHAGFPRCPFLFRCHEG